MLKNILRLLAASTSFVALLLMTNSAIALASVDNSTTQVRSTAIDLNLMSPSLESISDRHSSSHIGCSCAACVRDIQSI